MAQQGSELPALREAPARPGAVLQRRGIARVNAILRAADELLTEEGYEAATLKAISERTGIPAASVYHYFADRHQVDVALMNRHIAGITEALGDLSQATTVTGLVEAILDPQIAYFRDHPSCAELWLHGRSEALAAVANDFDAAAAEAVWHAAVDSGILPETTPRLVAQLAYAAGAALFDTAFKRDPHGDDAVIQETKRLVIAYLSTYAERATGAAPTSRPRRGSRGPSKDQAPARRRRPSA